jgi:hypothetical protein
MRGAIKNGHIEGILQMEMPERCGSKHWDTRVFMDGHRIGFFKLTPTVYTNVIKKYLGKEVIIYYEVVEDTLGRKWWNAVSLQCGNAVLWRYPGDKASVGSVGQ